jgi:anaerobic magnesium-protoporphyrin IX monomethyl ester cyclase
MRVLLIDPPTKNYYSEVGLNLMPLGIGYLAAMLEQAGHSVSVTDYQTESIDEKKIKFKDFDLVGISSDTPRFNSAVQIGQKARSEGAKVVFGGYHTSFLDEEPFTKGAADFVIKGEGEHTLVNLVDMLEHGGDLSRIKGLAYKPNGLLHRNEPAELIKNLDELPIPKRELFEADHYLSTFEGRRMATIVTSRGCPYDCYFCASSRLAGLKWRTRSLDSVFSELDYLLRNGHSSFIFIDDNFTLNYRRTIDFCDEVISRKWDIRWWCFSRVDTLVRHPEMVKKMADAGASTVFLGLESADQDILNNYQKRITLEQQEQAVKLLRENNIRIYGSFILGELHENSKMVKKTIRLAIRLKPETCQFSLLTPYPGSRLFQQLDKSQQLTTRDWDLYDGLHLVFKNPNFQVNHLERLVRTAYRRYYMRLSNIIKALKEVVIRPTQIKKLVDYIRTIVFISRLINHSKS